MLAGALFVIIPAFPLRTSLRSGGKLDKATRHALTQTGPNSFRNDIPPETLLDDAVRLARVAGAADVRVTLEVWPDMIHAWHQSLWRTKIQNFYLFCDLGYCED